MIVDGMLPKGMNRKEKILDKNRILLFTRASYEVYLVNFIDFHQLF